MKTASQLIASFLFILPVALMAQNVESHDWKKCLTTRAGFAPRSTEIFALQSGRMVHSAWTRANFEFEEIKSFTVDGETYSLSRIFASDTGVCEPNYFKRSELTFY